MAPIRLYIPDSTVQTNSVVARNMGGCPGPMLLCSDSESLNSDQTTDPTSSSDSAFGDHLPGACVGIGVVIALVVLALIGWLWCQKGWKWFAGAGMCCGGRSRKEVAGGTNGREQGQDKRDSVPMERPHCSRTKVSQNKDDNATSRNQDLDPEDEKEKTQSSAPSLPDLTLHETVPQPDLPPPDRPVTTPVNH